MTRSRINFANTDAAFCEKVTRIATAQGWKLDDMCNSISGCSYAFEHGDGRRVAGGITATKPSALLPSIYEYL